MTVNDLSQRVSELSQRLGELQAECASNPANASEILSDALENLQASLEELSTADEELMQQNEELIEAQLALIESERHYRIAIDFTYDWEYWLGPDRKHVYISPSCERITGYRPEEFMKSPLLDFDIVHPDDRATYEQHRKNHFDVHFGSEHIDYRIIAANGEIKWINHLCQPVFGENGEWLGRRASNRDITERKQAEENLRESKALLNSIFRSAPAGMGVGVNRIFIEANEQMCEITGYSREELLGKNARFIYPSDEDYETIARMVYGIAEKGGIGEVETRFRRKDGRIIDVYIRGASLVPGNVSEGISFAVLDITERKLMEEELCRSRDELELRVQERTSELQDAKENLEVINEELQVEISAHEKTEKELIIAKEAAEAAVEAKSAFLMNMSHELRTPLNAVIGFSSLLLDDNLTQDQKEHIESIRNGGQALLALINDILEYSMAEKEKVKLELQPLSLKRCIEESMGMVAFQAEQKGLVLTYAIRYGTQDTIIGDPGRLRQVLVNLLSNAVKFTDAGDISVSVSSKAIEGNKQQIQFAVKDTGIGMPQDKMDRLFQPFTQLEYTLSRKRDGAGLGLSICKKLVELMGGKIWAESEEGKGSTFKFTIQAETLPGKQLDLSEKEKAAVCENHSVQKPLSILVAEDNPSNQRVLVDMLKRLGYRADAVADGVEVLQALQIRPYDLVFMDIRMPEMDGLTATKEIRKLRPDNGPKVVAITAFAMDKDRETCLEAGMDGYIAKPVDIDDLVMLLRNITFHTKE